MKKITKETMVQYLLIFFIAAIMTMIGNCINTVTDKNPDTFVSILDGIPGLLILMAIALVSSILGFLVPKVPTIVWITRASGKAWTSASVHTGSGLCRRVHRKGLGGI